MQSLGDKIFELRKKSGMSQEELSYEVGVSRQTISKWESNSMKPNLDSIKSLSDIFKVPLDYLIKDELDSVVAADSIDTLSDNADNITNNHVEIDNSKMCLKRNNIITTSLAVIFSVFSFILIVLSLIVGRTALSTNTGDDTISNFKYDSWMFYLCLTFTIIFFIFAIIFWVKTIKCRKNQM